MTDASIREIDSLQKEKGVIENSWAKKEKQIERAFQGLANIYRELHGIVGSTLPELKGFKFPELTENKTDSFQEENNEKGES